jgi:hypothetical protein
VSQTRVAQHERAPETRSRHALAARWNRHLFTDTVLQSHLRLYLDDWGVASVTAGVEYLVGFGAFTVGVHLRGYGQAHASFYRPRYEARMRYMTADRELSSFVDGFGGVRALWRSGRMRFIEEIHAEVKVDGFGFWFFDFPRLQARNGVIVEAALGASL